jgi:hypothetical protein
VSGILDHVDVLLKMGNSPIRNYVIPGVTSALLGAPAADGSVVRLFESAREQVESVTPHSHRYGFAAVVLRGWVDNVIWRQAWAHDADFYVETPLRFGGASGAYTRGESLEPKRFARTETRYEPGESYSMAAHEIHSIWFSRGAVVLMFEGPHVADESVILEPWVDGEVISNGAKVEPWMFKRGALP